MPDLPFPVEEHRARLAAVRARMKERGVQALLVTSGEDTYYLTGFRTTAFWAFVGLIVPQAGSLSVVLRDFDRENVEALSIIDEALGFDDDSEPIPLVVPVLKKICGENGTIAVQKHSYWLTVKYYEQLHAALPRATFVDMFDDLTQMRQVKSPAELAYVRKAAEMVTEAMKAGIEAVHEGALESDVALEVQRILALRGSEYVASPVFISSSPLPHATAMPDKLDRGAVISIEFGASYKRYHATNTRAVCVGEATPEVRRVSEACLEAFDAAGAEIRPGAAFQNVDRAARRVFQKYDLLPYFRHRIAYTIGIGFSPTWGPRVGGDCNYLNMTSASKTELKEGMVFHLLPLVFIPGMGAMGFSETIVVTKTGWEALTTVRRELMVR